MKRSAEDAVSQNMPKRIRHTLHHKQPGWMFAHACPQDKGLIDAQLGRALGLVLHGAGFEGVQKDAMESFQLLAEEYLSQLSNHVKASMQNNRRTKPLPTDFAIALSRFGATPRAFKQDLRDHTFEVASQPLLLPPAKALSDASFSAQLDRNVSDTNPNHPRRGVPRFFPSFPPDHSFKDTPIMTQRESDARKVRELATKEGMQAEYALRKLMGARQSGNRSKNSRGDGQNGLINAVSTEDHQLFKQALAAMATVDTEAEERDRLERNMGVHGIADELPKEIMLPTDVDFGAIVNYDKIHWRKSAANMY